MKNILVVCPCSLRGNSIGLIADLLDQFKKAKDNGCSFDLFDTNFFQNHDPNKYDVRKYFCIKKGFREKFIQRIPIIRSRFAKKLFIDKFKSILSLNSYDYVLFYKIPVFADILVDIAHDAGSKVMFFPWGSEILRANVSQDVHLKDAYSKVDYVLGYDKSNLNIKASTIYNVPSSKIITLKTIFKGVKAIKDISKQLSRYELSKKIGINTSEFNIICGYSGCETQRHIQMIEAFAANKKILPSDYQLIFPVTYVAKHAYVQKLRDLCTEYKLNAIFLTEYLSDEQIACLHLVTDLFINIQPTDAGNYFMIEALYSRNEIITGKWLHYDQFEEFGIPYYLLNELEDLATFIKEYFTGNIKKIDVPDKLIAKYDYPDDYDKGDFWLDLFCHLS